MLDGIDEYVQYYGVAFGLVEGYLLYGRIKISGDLYSFRHFLGNYVFRGFGKPSVEIMLFHLHHALAHFHFPEVEGNVEKVLHSSGLPVHPAERLMILVLGGHPDEHALERGHDQGEGSPQFMAHVDEQGNLFLIKSMLLLFECLLHSPLFLFGENGKDDSGGNDCARQRCQNDKRFHVKAA